MCKLNKMNVNVKNLKIKRQPLHWFGLTELNKTKGIMCVAGIVAKYRYQMKFCNSHLTRNIFNLCMRRFFFGLVYTMDNPDLTESNFMETSIGLLRVIWNGFILFQVILQ